MKVAHIAPPTLAIDELLFAGGRKMLAHSKVERRVVANLIAHMQGNGFKVVSVYDGEEETNVSTMQEAMELIFNLDEASLRFAPAASAGDDDDWHGVLIVLGNGVDCIADWSYSKGDGDGFNAIMKEFNAEDFE